MREETFFYEFQEEDGSLLFSVVAGMKAAQRPKSFAFHYFPIKKTEQAPKSTLSRATRFCFRNFNGGGLNRHKISASTSPDKVSVAVSVNRLKQLLPHKSQSDLLGFPDLHSCP